MAAKYRRFKVTAVVPDRRVPARYRWRGWVAFDTVRPLDVHARFESRADCVRFCDRLNARKGGV